MNRGDGAVKGIKDPFVACYVCVVPCALLKSEPKGYNGGSKMDYQER